MAVLLLLVAAPVEATFTHLATASMSSSASTGATTGNIDTTASGGADLIVCHAGFYNGGSEGENPILTDSASNSWTKLETESSVSYSSALWYKISPATSGTHNFTVSGVESYPAIQCAAFTATGTVSFEAESAGGAVTDAGPASVQPGSLTPSGDDRVFITGLMFHTSNTASINSSFSIGAQDNVGANNEGGAIAYRIQVSAGALNPTWSWSTNSFAAATMATFSDSGGGGGGGATTKHLTMLGVGLLR